MRDGGSYLSRKRLPRRLGTGLKALIGAAALLYIALLLAFATRPQGIPLGFAILYPIGVAFILVNLRAISDRHRIGWDEEGVHATDLASRSFPRPTRVIPFKAISSVRAELRQDGMPDIQTFAPFDTIVLADEAGDDLLAIRSNFVDEGALKALLHDVRVRGGAHFSDELLAYISSRPAIF